jgi:hypothetical protein
MRLRDTLVLLPAGIALVVLFVRLGQDVHGTPLIEDEAIAGLIGARPVGELLGTVVWDRGGAPLHFLLVHGVLSVDSSAAALRWLSVAFAIGAVVTCFELGRRLAGPVAGSAAAIAGATSGLLTIYGSIARMYSLFAFVGGLAAVLFVRALERRTAEAAFTAAVGAWLLPAVHPYGGIAVAGEAVVALWLWRGRPLRPALPALAVGLAMLPFAVVDVRLADRFDVGGHGRALAGPRDAWDQLELVIRGSAGGGGLVLIAFLVLGAIGLAALMRKRPPVAALTALWLLVPPVLFLVLQTSSSRDLSPRHLVYALPLVAAAIGVGASRVVEPLQPAAQAAVLGLLLLAGVIAPAGITDPRSLTYVAGVSGEDELAAPTARLRAGIHDGDVLFPYSPVFLAALPESGDARSLPRAEPELLARAVRRVELPAGDIWVAIPGHPWVVVRRPGPFRDRASVLDAVAEAIREHRSGTLPPDVAGYEELSLAVIAAARTRLDSSRAR